MAKSLSKKFGQQIGDLLEYAFEPILRQFSIENNLFLDKKGKRKARGGKKLVKWQDFNGNKHNLDFVLEKSGNQEKIGIPVAFIEAAWRRYTRHSKNKVQEIQGAIEPLKNTFNDSFPFYGGILAGEYTHASIDQLKSLGFSILQITYQDVISAFDSIGIDARYDDNTPEEDFIEKILQLNNLSIEQKTNFSEFLLQISNEQVSSFMKQLKSMVDRRIISIKVFPLHGNQIELLSIVQAVTFIDEYKENPSDYPFVRYEIDVIFNNNDRIQGSFSSKALAKEFLRKLVSN